MPDSTNSFHKKIINIIIKAKRKSVVGDRYINASVMMADGVQTRDTCLLKSSRNA